MPKRADQARVRAAVAAGDPPVSSDHPEDGAWHDAQRDWIAKWSGRLLPEDGPQRRRQWDKRKEEHARLVAAAALATV